MATNLLNDKATLQSPSSQKDTFKEFVSLGNDLGDYDDTDNFVSVSNEKVANKDTANSGIVAPDPGTTY